MNLFEFGIDVFFVLTALSFHMNTLDQDTIISGILSILDTPLHLFKFIYNLPIFPKIFLESGILTKIQRNLQILPTPPTLDGHIQISKFKFPNYPFTATSLRFHIF